MTEPAKFSVPQTLHLGAVPLRQEYWGAIANDKGGQFYFGEETIEMNPEKIRGGVSGAKAQLAIMENSLWLETQVIDPESGAVLRGLGFSSERDLGFGLVDFRSAIVVMDRFKSSPELRGIITEFTHEARANRIPGLIGLKEIFERFR